MVTGAGFTGAGERELKKGGPDALTPALSHGEREKTLKKATFVAFLLLPWSRTHQRSTRRGVGILLEVFDKQFRQRFCLLAPLFR